MEPKKVYSNNVPEAPKLVVNEAKSIRSSSPPKYVVQKKAPSTSSKSKSPEPESQKRPASIPKEIPEIDIYKRQKIKDEQKKKKQEEMMKAEKDRQIQKKKSLSPKRYAMP